MNKNYGGLIWTNHALQRLNERGIKQGDAWSVWNRPEQSRYSTTKGAWIYYRTYGNERIEVVVKQNEKKEWIVLSVWSRQVNNLNKNIHKDQKQQKSFLLSLLRKIFFND